MREDPIIERIAKLEADVEWLKKLATTNVVVSVSTLISFLLLILYLVVK